MDMDERDDIDIPNTPAGIEELLGDTDRMEAVFADKDKFGELIASYRTDPAEETDAIAEET